MVKRNKTRRKGGNISNNDPIKEKYDDIRHRQYITANQLNELIINKKKIEKYKDANKKNYLIQLCNSLLVKLNNQNEFLKSIFEMIEAYEIDTRSNNTDPTKFIFALNEEINKNRDTFDYKLEADDDYKTFTIQNIPEKSYFQRMRNSATKKMHNATKKMIERPTNNQQPKYWKNGNDSNLNYSKWNKKNIKPMHNPMHQYRRNTGRNRPIINTNTNPL